MKVEVVHDFPCTPDEWFDVLESDALEEAITEAATSKRVLVEQRREGDILVRRWHITPTRELPAVAQKLIGAKNLDYFQTSRVDRANRRVDWQIEVPVVGSRAAIGGVLEVEAIPTGCRRTMRGEVIIRVPVLGKRIEASIAGDVEKTYTRSHRLIMWLLSA